ncbi:MAG: S9 family peptidase [Streptomycetaceae bacterium]|nr:S9 family peptidase [Streptomycetaceae bacterium]
MAGGGSLPLSAGWVARKQTSYDELTCVSGALWWLQSNPDLGGASQLVRAAPGEKPQVHTPLGVSVGGWLHAYGGGSYALGPNAQWIVSAADSKVYQVSPDTAPRRVVPGDDGFLYGDLHVAEGALLAVRGTDEGDQIVEIHPEREEVRVLVSSSGFLAAPRLRGGRLAYVEWDADRMPWDASRLVISDSAAVSRPATVVAGGEEESVIQPTWGPDGALYFLSDRTGWWNLYRWDGSARLVAPMDADGAPAPWEAGYQSYAFLPEGSVVLTVHDGLRTRLITIGADGSQKELDTGLTSLKPYIAALGNKVAVIGSSPASTPAVWVVDPASGALDRWAEPVPTPDHDPQPVSMPPAVCEARSGDTAIRYLLHLPPSGKLPVPLLIRAHPGPTAEVPMRLDWIVQYFTSQGFAVAEVAYRGSTGHGRAFRQALYGRWGEYDVEDCQAVARQLLADGIVLPGAVFITGASAGGYTALQAACRRGPFTAATAISAITDPARWATTAPRFQRPHAATLRGPAGAVRAEALRIPVLLIHGMADDIAPVSDAQQLADGLAAHGADHEALFLDSVGHYLSSPASLTAALEAELRFYRRFIPAAG